MHRCACVRECMHACVCHIVQWLVQSISNRKLVEIDSIPAEYGHTRVIPLFYLWVVTNSQNVYIWVCVVEKQEKEVSVAESSHHEPCGARPGSSTVVVNSISFAMCLMVVNSISLAICWFNSGTSTMVVHRVLSLDLSGGCQWPMMCVCMCVCMCMYVSVCVWMCVHACVHACVRVYVILLHVVFTHGQIGVYSWISGLPVTYSNWSPNEPNDWYHSEDCTEIFSKNSRWNDRNCSWPEPFICMMPDGKLNWLWSCGATVCAIVGLYGCLAISVWCSWRLLMKRVWYNNWY